MNRNGRNGLGQFTTPPRISPAIVAPVRRASAPGIMPTRSATGWEPDPDPFVIYDYPISEPYIEPPPSIGTMDISPGQDPTPPGAVIPPNEPTRTTTIPTVQSFFQGQTNLFGFQIPLPPLVVYGGIALALYLIFKDGK